MIQISPIKYRLFFYAPDYINMVILPIIAFLVTPIIAAPSPALCAVPGDESALVECPNPRPVIPDSTTGYSCNPPIVDAANAPLPYTFKNPTADQLAVNRRIEKAMGRGECTLTDNELQNIYNTFGDGLASVYPPPDYVREEAEALKSQKVCYVTCIDATDPTTIAWCNANACPIVVSGQFLSFFYRKLYELIFFS